jgi:hypothetical protein
MSHNVIQITRPLPRAWRLPTSGGAQDGAARPRLRTPHAPSDWRYVAGPAAGRPRRLPTCRLDAVAGIQALYVS